MKKLTFLIILNLLVVNSNCATWYVNINATGSNNGTSWANAYNNLQDAITASSFGDQIWVAAGVYKPTTTTTRSISFNIKNGTKVYGGFNGTETLLSERNPDLNITTLSGEIGSGVSTDNSYHVVYFSSVGNQTRLDGFYIVGGYTNGLSTNSGGGVYSTSSSPIIENCKFYGNYAEDEGGAIVHKTSGSITIKSCVFSGNVTTAWGGALAINAGVASISDSYFESNLAGSGGAIDLSDGTTNIDRCIIAGNMCNNLGSAIVLSNDNSVLVLSNSLIIGNYSDDKSVIYSYLSNAQAHSITNCIIANNHQVNTAGATRAINLYGASSTKNSIIWGNTSGAQINSAIDVTNCIVQGGFVGGINILNINPLFINAGITNTAPFDTTGLNYRLQIMSQAIDYGNNTYVVGSTDLDGNSRIQGTAVDLGAYESNYCNSSATISPGFPFTICNGNPLTLSVPGGVQFLWSTGSTSSSINVSSAGNYSVIVADTTGCRGSLQATVTASSSPNPTISYTGGSLTTGTYSTYQWLYNGDTIPGATTNLILPSFGYGIYSVEVTNSGGCIGTTTYCYSSATFLTSGPTTFCAGNSVILWVSGGTGFLWSNSDTDSSITVSSSGNYSVIVQDTVAGCSVNFQQVITVNTNPNPIITYGGGSFSTGSFTSYQWYFNGSPISGATSNNLTPTNGNGQYSVIVANSSSCTGASSVYNFFLGLKENDKFDFFIYPNPVDKNGTLHINSTNTELQDVNISLIDISGKKIFDKVFEEIPNQIPLMNVKPGVYIFTLNNEHVKKTYRIIVL